jgi:16S rRNA (cytidine1402-2'-O)-methyltransferase
MPGKLMLIPTPIGNLKDITLRVLDVLTEVDLILAEDTRTSHKLMSHYGITTPMQSFHMHNEHKVVAKYVGELQHGKTLALVSDAGTPGISDPGYLLVREAIKGGIAVEALPGPTAFLPALLASGLPCEKFIFEGFLPHKKGRQTRLKLLAEETRTMIFYESVHRMQKSLEEMAQYFGPDRPASYSREITKKFEETARGTLSELIEHVKATMPRGEFVVVVGGLPAGRQGRNENY